MKLEEFLDDPDVSSYFNVSVRLHGLTSTIRGYSCTCVLKNEDILYHTGVEALWGFPPSPPPEFFVAIHSDSYCNSHYL